MFARSRAFAILAATVFWLAVPAAFPGRAAAGAATELIMVEQEGCVYCEQWDTEILPIYARTAESKVAPLRKMDLFDGFPGGISFARAVNFTPTFVLVRDGVELARIEGYPGEDFFWGLLGMMLEKYTDFGGES